MNAKLKTLKITKPMKLGAFLLIIGIILIASNMRAAITSVGPLIEDIQRDVQLSSTTAGLLTTLPLLAFAFLSPIAPRLANRFGLERVLFASMIILAGGIITRSVSSISGIMLGTIAIGLAIAVCNVLLPGLIKRDFSVHIGLMTGMYSSFMNIFAALASGLSVPLALSFSGWRFSLSFWAFLAIFAAIIWIPQLTKQHQSSGPNTNIIHNEKAVKIWTNPLAWKVSLFMGLQSLCFYVTAAWIPSILQFKGMDHLSAGWMLSLMQFVSIPTTFLIPIIAGRSINQRGTVVLTIMFSFIGFTGLAFFSQFLLPLWIVFIGLGAGGNISLALTIITLRARTAKQAAELSGMAQSIGYLLAAIGPIFFGYLFDQLQSWTIPLYILVATTIMLFFVGWGAGNNKYIDE